MKKSTTLSQEVVEDLNKYGADLSKTHDFDFYLYFQGKDDAERAAQELKQENFIATIKPSSDNNEWLCLAKKSFMPTIQNLNIVENLLAALINKFKGEFDGWESNIIK